MGIAKLCHKPEVRGQGSGLKSGSKRGQGAGKSLWKHKGLDRSPEHGIERQELGRLARNRIRGEANKSITREQGARNKQTGSRAQGTNGQDPGSMKLGIKGRNLENKNKASEPKVSQVSICTVE